MSYKVTNEIRDSSRAKHGTFNLLLAIGGIAHHDGVGWASIGPPDDKKSLSFQARLSPRQIGRAIVVVRELDELEVRIARRGRRRFYVYRVIVGWLRAIPVDYERGLPELTSLFWTPEELLLDRADRRPDEKLTSGHFVQASEAGDALGEEQSHEDGDDPARADEMSGRQGAAREDISDADERTSATATSGHLRRPTRARESERSLGKVPGKVQDDLPSRAKEDRAGGPARPASPVKKELIDGLIRAFAEELGGWPEGRSEWGAWAKAFRPLAAAGVDAEQLRQQTRRYRAWLIERKQAARQQLVRGVDWPDREGAVADLVDLTPFGLTRHWQLIEASLASSYFALHRWVTGVSWRYEDPLDAAWVIDSAASISVPERAQLHRLAREVRSAHADPGSDLLRWVESPGAFLSDEDWRAHFDGLQIDPDLKRRANERRLAIRADLANLRLRERGAA